MEWTVVLGAVVGLLLTIIGYFWNRDNARRDRDIEALFTRAHKNDEEHRFFGEGLVRLEGKVDGVKETVDRVNAKLNGDRR